MEVIVLISSHDSKLTQTQHKVDRDGSDDSTAKDRRTVWVVPVDSGTLTQLVYTIRVHAAAVDNGQECSDSEASCADPTSRIVCRNEVE